MTACNAVARLRILGLALHSCRIFSFMGSSLRIDPVVIVLKSSHGCCNDV
jgi:hypothetical protein